MQPAPDVKMSKRPQVRFCRDRFPPTGRVRIQGRGRVRIQVHCIPLIVNFKIVLNVFAKLKAKVAYWFY
jgi:hypothetical protein